MIPLKKYFFPCNNTIVYDFQWSPWYTIMGKLRTMGGKEYVLSNNLTDISYPFSLVDGF